MCGRCVRLCLRRGRSDGQSGGARSDAIILVFTIFMRIFAMGGVRALQALRHCL